MEMMIPGFTAPTKAASKASQHSSSHSSKTPGSNGFQKALVHQMNGSSARDKTAPTDNEADMKPLNEGAAAEQDSAVEGMERVVKSEGAAETVSLDEAAGVKEQLLPLIDELLTKLGLSDSEVLTMDSLEQGLAEAADVEELGDLLDQLNALLALLGAVPVKVQPEVEVQSENAESSASRGEEAAVAVKVGLQNALLQLQQLVEQGPLPRIQHQDSEGLVSEQLEALNAMLRTDKKEPAAATASAKDAAPFTASTPVGAQAAAHLERLSQQVIHPAVLTVIQPEAGGQSAESSLTEESVADEAAPVSLNAASAQDASLKTAPAISRPITQSYVMADQFAESMTGLLVQKFNVTTVNGLSEAKIMLFPEHMGQVDVKISVQNGQLTAIFQTDTLMAKDALESQMMQLRTALQNQGLHVDKLEVSQGGQAAQMSQDGGGGRGSQQSSSGQSHGGSGSASAETIFEAEMAEQAAIQGLGFGRAVNVKA
ncbi:flagellar hook-length control protein FliK [Paenibacillus sp. GCM10023252]|uniref:flagellar hook-length control protein FliK n=1 Tax=Paenibacillus sp. GCM10023252 TaxID=3252649 RepID=UPI00360B1E92